MDVNRELTSRYADGEVTPEERKRIEALLRDDPATGMDLDDYRMVEELFGHVEPESVSEECLERLYAMDESLDLTGTTSTFERVHVPPIRRIRWGSWAAAAAAILLAVVGISQLTYRPEVTLRDFARLSLDASGAVVKTERLDAVTVASGHTLAAGPRERVTYRDPLGARVVLMPESRLEVGDPRKSELLDLTQGTALITVYESAEERTVGAGGYFVRSLGADFAVRIDKNEIRGAGIRGAGAALAAAGGAQVTVAVRSGSCEVGSNGHREQVDASWRVVLRHGAPAERSPIWEDPLFRNLMEGRGREILPGFFSGESGVRAIRHWGWDRIAPSEHELVVSDNEAASIAQWLVFEVVLDQPTALEVAMIRPLHPDLQKEGEVPSAERTVVRTSVVPAGRRVVAIPIESLGKSNENRRTIEIPASRSRLVRLRLRSADSENSATGTPFEIKASLWSARPPASDADVVR
ncbi:MAG: anti-sigma factor [Planctomycetota bacterium]|jgi:hypothetical protein